MIKVFEAAKEFHYFLTSKKIPYAIIGGLAVQQWGNPRLTRDLDLTILIPVEKTEKCIDLLTSQFEARISDVKEMARKNRILLMRASNGCDVDISIALPGYEDELIKRSQKIAIEGNNQVYVCSAEDLIIHKAAAGRARDLEDIVGVIDRNGKHLDVQYIRTWLKNFSLILETDEVLNRFEVPYAEWQDWKRQNPD